MAMERLLLTSVATRLSPKCVPPAENPRGEGNCPENSFLKATPLSGRALMSAIGGQEERPQSSWIYHPGAHQQLPGFFLCFGSVMA